MTVECIDPEGFPPQLRELPQPPSKLWMRGLWPSKETKYLAVVGSRALTPYGQQACELLIAGLAGYPVSIVSGLALGADGCAHRAALNAGLHTIAIPGSGLGESVLYPAAHRKLARDILESGGLLLSEHPPDYVAHTYDFPSRNRIMVGLAQAVLVIEAGKDSGTLITARLAGEYNRELLCVPHRIGDRHGHAAHVFLRYGATHVTESLHIVEALGITPRADDPSLQSARRPPSHLSGNDRILYDLLVESLPRDDIIRLSGLPPGDALTALISLEMKGFIEERFGAWQRV